MIPLVLEPLSKATTSNPPSCAGNCCRLRHQSIKKGDFRRVFSPRCVDVVAMSTPVRLRDGMLVI
jgi:hypothetical protein